jgi:Gas vesicle protein
MRGNVIHQDSMAAQGYSSSAGTSHSSTNLGDILERVLDKGLVIAGDIQVNLLDIELLTIKLRLVVASLETARQVGIDWWEEDPWLSASATRRAMSRDRDGDRELEAENRRLRAKVRELESGQPRARREDDRD